MDHRIPLKFHTVLPFDGMPCHIEQVIGQGSNAIVYKGWYPDRISPHSKHHVLIKELFPYHPRQKIFRDPSGQIITEPGAQEVWDTHRASFEAGNAVHLRLLERQPELMVMGANLNSFALNGTLYSVLGYTGGRSLADDLNQSEQELRRCVQRMLRLLDALEAFHDSGYLHLDISPDNIMLVGRDHREQLFLIDYNSARQVKDHSGSYLSCNAGYSAPEVSTGDEDSICYASDLYSVTAVFYRCLMGRKLTLAETLQPKAPDGRNSPLLSGAPQTVVSMVGRILRKGLHTLASRRYSSIEQLRKAFRELLQRIDGTGVTHWALWESGTRSVEERIRMNPALAYLKDPRSLYPIRLEQGGTILLEQYVETLVSADASSGLIVAQGGMGKTTLLLHTAALLGKRYSPTAPAVFYIPLNGWNGTDTTFIRTRILRSLRFGREENTFDSAMQSLHTLLRQPLKTKAGPVPSVLLLLDGLNEVQGQTGPLMQEILELCAMEGVRILAASRSEAPSLPLTPLQLAPLTCEDAEAALGDRGLLIPESPEVMQLLRTPLILSIYIRASEGKQLDIHNQGELMDAYLAALKQKEQDALTEDQPEYWQTDAALTLILPRIAEETRRRGGALTDARLLAIMRQSWKLLRSPAMHRIFPQWIGRSRDILGSAQTPEQWYGILVHTLLWQRLGLLIREPEGGYRVFHQVVADHLAEKAKNLLPFRYRAQRLIAAVAAAAVCAGLVTCFTLYRGEATRHAQKAIEYTASGYRSSGSLYEQLKPLSDYALQKDTRNFFLWYDRAMDSLSQTRRGTTARETYLAYLSDAAEKGYLNRVSWSGLPFYTDTARELLEHSEEQAVYYSRMVPVLAGWLESELMQHTCPDFPQLFQTVLEADAALVSELYQQSCAIHLSSGDRQWAAQIQSMTAELTTQEAHRTGITADHSKSISELRANLRSAKADLENRVSRMDMYLRENTRTAQHQLDQLRRIVREAGIDSSDTALNSLEQILENMNDYVHHRFSR